MSNDNKKKAAKISSDLLPVTLSGKNTGGLGYFNVWIGIGIIIATFAVGGEAAYYCNLKQIALAAIVGTFVLGCFFCVSSDIGVEHGLSFPVYVGAVLGKRGTALPNALRTIYGPIWFGVQSYFGATAINQIVVIFTGYDNWLLWFIVFVIIQVINTACGFSAMEKVANIAAPTIMLIGIYMVIRLFGLASANGIDAWNSVYSDELGAHIAKGNANMILYVMMLALNYWADNACEVETWSRYVKTDKGEKKLLKRNKRAIPGYIIALPLASGFMIFLGALSTLTTGNFNPIEAISAVTNNPVILVLLLVMIIMAQWSTNAVCNLMPSGVCIVALFRSRIPYWLGVCICGFIGAVIQPWVLVDHIGIFLTITGSLWSTIYGMTIVDFFLIRKRRLNVPDLYREDGGQYFYANGINPAGIISFIVGLGACMLFSSVAFIAGSVVSGICYYVLKKLWVLKKYPQKELSQDQESFAGISANREWVYDEETNSVKSSI